MFGGKSGNVRDSPYPEPTVRARRQVLQQRGVCGQGDLRPSQPLRPVRVPPSEKLTQNHRVVILPDNPIQICQAIADGIQLVDLRLFGRMGEGKPRTYERLGPHPLDLLRFQTRLPRLAPGEACAVASLRVVLRRLDLHLFGGQQRIGQL